MISQLRFLGALILAVQFSACPAPTRMAWKYDYPGSKSETLDICKTTLEELGYSIDIYAPESQFLVTEARAARYFMRQYQYSVIIGVTDEVNIYLTASKDIFKRSSQVSLFGSTMLNSEAEDKLPKKLQDKIIFPINAQLKSFAIEQSIYPE